MGNNMKLKKIYKSQFYINEKIVRKKQKAKDYVVTIAKIKDNGRYVWMIIDGNHALEAAKRDRVKPVFRVDKIDFKNVKEFIEADGSELINPVEITTGEKLWFTDQAVEVKK